MQRICVFCGSATGASPDFKAAAIELGTLLAKQQITLVYGGSNIGLMGALADAALAAGGQVIGVIPRSLVDREVAHRGLTELRIVETMHARKTLMAGLADAFIALPGGFGTLDELCEILTWAQLGIHSKAVVLLNTLRYWDRFLQFLDEAVNAGFLKPSHRQSLRIGASPREVLARLTQSETIPLEPKL